MQADDAAVTVDEASHAPVRRLKILAIAHSAVNRTSGRVRYETLAALRPDIDLTLVAPARWEEYGKPMPLDPHDGPLDFRVEKVRLPQVPRAGWYLHHYPRLGRIIKELRPDVIQLWEEPWSVVALQAIWLRDRMRPQAAIMLETEQNVLRRLPPPFEQIRRHTLRRADLLVGRQPEALEVARACGFAGPTAIVEYGVSTVFGPGDRAVARAALGLPDDAFVLGYVGRIVPEKGLRDVLDAMAACPAPVTLVVLGTGPDLEAVAAHARTLNLSERLHVLSPRPPAEVARVMAALDSLVLMSRQTRSWKEQFGRVIMEAHACGIPVIGSGSGAIPGVVGPGGWIVPEGDAPALSRLLARLVANPDEVAAAGALGRRQAQTRFAAGTVANALANAAVMAATTRAASTRAARVGRG